MGTIGALRSASSPPPATTLPRRAVFIDENETIVGPAVIVVGEPFVDGTHREAIEIPLDGIIELGIID